MLRKEARLMAIAKMTLIGMDNYFNGHLFDGLQLPAPFDHETAVNTILMRGGEFPVLWANPDFVRNMIRVWSGKNQLTFRKFAQAMEAEFDPTYNYDRYEEWTDKAQEDSEASGSADNSSTTRVSAYDSATLQPESSLSGETSSSSTGSRKNDSAHKGHIYGNIGVVTATKMLTEFMEFYQDFNVYDILADMFCKEFCTMIY